MAQGQQIPLQTDLSVLYNSDSCMCGSKYRNVTAELQIQKQALPTIFHTLVYYQ